jgi:5'-nucleotidase / UDP-sugar diphosphatase
MGEALGRITVAVLAMITVFPSILLATDAQKMEPSTSTLTILHTNDLHGHLMAWKGWEEPLLGKTVGGADRLATVINQIRDSVGSDKLLVLDGGDTFGDTMLAAETQGRAVVEVMNVIGYDAMVVGNHDPDFTIDVLRERIHEAHFAVLAANLIDSQTGQPSIQPALIREVAGVKVGVVGLAYPNTALTTLHRNLTGITFLPAVETARQWVPRLREEGAQLIVVLSHCGLGADIALAQIIEGIDVIIGGHSHNRVESPIQVGRTVIVQAGAHGSDVGRLDLSIRNGGIVGFTGKLITVDNSVYAPDLAMAGLVQKLRDLYRHRLEKTVGHASEAIPRAQTIAGPRPQARAAESPLDSLFADILREVLLVDVVLLPGLGYGVAIGPGPVTEAALRNVLPHESHMITMRLTGTDLLELLEQAVENVLTKDPHEKVGGILQVSGMTFTYTSHKAYPTRVQVAAVLGKPLVQDKVYEVATNSLLAQGGHRHQTFLNGKDRTDKGSQYEMIREWFLRHGPIQAPRSGRIRTIQ